MSRINETLKQKIDELDLDRRVNEAVEQAEVLLVRALDSAGDYAREHRDDVDQLLGRISDKIDDRTAGRYADQVSRVREQIVQGVERLAERPTQDPPGDA
jgi:hypothetical protein